MNQCPDCRSPRPPEYVSKIATAGWVVFAALLFFCFPLCWLGLFITEQYRVCPQCGRRSELTANDRRAGEDSFFWALLIGFIFVVACAIIGLFGLSLLPHLAK